MKHQTNPSTNTPRSHSKIQSLEKDGCSRDEYWVDVGYGRWYYHYLLSIVFYHFQNQQHQRKQMIEQIKNINRLMERSIYQHQNFFNHMRHWFDWSHQHQDCENDKD